MSLHIVVAVEDSAPSLAAAAAAIALARDHAGAITFVTVLESGHTSSTMASHVAASAAKADVAADVVVVHGEPPFEMILREAHRQHADLIVMGRSDKRRPGSPHVGSQTEHLLEFTDLPVLVVPTPGSSRHDDPSRHHNG